ncbi:TspO/MBR family protein [Corynebacterium occultum]|nr:TspO/MBR family protein [Corynebacterium occultum]
MEHNNTAPGFRGALLKTGAAVTTAATIGTILTDPENRWYKSLAKPSWQPPKAAFPIAWTALYTDIAVVSASVISAEEAKKENSSSPYQLALSANLVLNAGWTGLFFRSRQPWLAAVGAAVLAGSSIDLTRRAWQSSPARGLALSPYAAWTSFATALSTSIAWMNR